MQRRFTENNNNNQRDVQNREIVQMARMSLNARIKQQLQTSINFKLQKLIGVNPNPRHNFTLSNFPQNMHHKLALLKSHHHKNKQKYMLLHQAIKSSGINLVQRGKNPNSKLQNSTYYSQKNKSEIKSDNYPLSAQLNKKPNIVRIPFSKQKLVSDIQKPSNKFNKVAKQQDKNKTVSLKQIFQFKKQNKYKYSKNIINQITTNYYKKANRPIFYKDIPPLKSFAHIVLGYPNLQIYTSHRAQLSIQVASLTKIMTCYCILKICQDYQHTIEQTCKVVHMAQGIGGTTAEIIAGEIYTVQQLLYGIMLPSGNDASIMLAIWGGRILSQKENKVKNKQAYNLFIGYMNKVGRELGLKNTRYANPHGLCNSQNKSSAADVALLSSFAMKSAVFLKLINTKEITFNIENQKGQKRSVFWQNTNKLLGNQDGFYGIKTGQTTSAGPCLASYYKKQINFIVVVLNVGNNLLKRFKQTKVLVKWLLKMIFQDKQKNKEQVSDQET